MTSKLLLGSQFPNFTADTTQGSIDFYQWLGDSWGILFSHPADFTPVCTTELSRMAKLHPEFVKRNVKIIALSIDSVESHNEWIKDMTAFAKLEGDAFPYPIIDDTSRKLATQFNMLDLDEINKEGMPLTARSVFVVDSKKKLRLSLLYPATTGRNFDEILRVVDSMQLTDKKKVATPVDWKPGDNCIVPPNVKQDEVEKLFPEGVTIVDLPSGKPYLRYTNGGCN